jgi:Ca2+-binding RTX toxin-like protein
LDGGLGDDKIGDFGGGINTLTGGSGADTFEVDSGSGYSVITDFTPNQDELRYYSPSSLRFQSLNGTPYESFIGYEGIFDYGSLVAITQGIGTAQAAIDSALQA